MGISLLNKIIIPLIFIGVLGYFGYTIFIKSPVLSGDLVTDSATDTSNSKAQEILTLVNKLKNISIDQEIFSSRIFISLKDFGTVLIPEPQVRLNPFLPIGVEGNL